MYFDSFLPTSLQTLHFPTPLSKLHILSLPLSPSFSLFLPFPPFRTHRVQPVLSIGAWIYRHHWTMSRLQEATPLNKNDLPSMPPLPKALS